MLLLRMPWKLATKSKDKAQEELGSNKKGKRIGQEDDRHA